MYAALNEIPRLNRSYSAKFLVLAFLGIHLLIIGLVIALELGKWSLSSQSIILIVLAATLIASLVTLLALNKLTKPLRDLAKELQEFTEEGKMPKINVTGSEEMSALSQNIVLAITELETKRKQTEDLTMLLSHDLRAPIATSIASLAILNEMQEEERIQQVNDLRSYLADQLSFIDIVLNIQKSEKRLNKSDLEKIDLHDVCKAATEVMKKNLEQKEISLDLQLEKPTCLGHPQMVQQAVVNLLQNAIKFSDRGQTIRVPGSPNATNYHLHVIDQGEGMESSTIDRLFKSSFIEGLKGTEGEKSTGLGLYLTQNLMQNQQGSVKAQSGGLNKGSTFTLSFPLTH